MKRHVFILSFSALAVLVDYRQTLLLAQTAGASVDRFTGLRRVAEQKEISWQDLQKQLKEMLLVTRVLPCDGSIEAKIERTKATATESYGKWRDYYQETVNLASRRLKNIGGEIASLNSLRTAKAQLSTEEEQTLAELQRRKSNLEQALKTEGMPTEPPTRPLQELIQRSERRKLSSEKLLSQIDEASQSYRAMQAILSRNLEIANDHIEFAALELSVWQTYYKARLARVDLDCVGREKIFERKATFPK
jgi:hypothetical protein